jgi:glutaredoxin
MTYLVVGKSNCTFCDKAVSKLKSEGIDYIYIDLNSGDSISNIVWTELLVEKLKVKKVPQIFKLIGGFTDLESELNDG